MIRGVLGSAAVVLAALASQAGYPRQILHRPPTLAPRGKALPVAVSVLGSSEAVSVVLRYRPQGEIRYETLVLGPDRGGVYGGEIPASAAGSLSIEYHIDVTGAGGAWRLDLGSAADPIRVSLVEPLQETGTPLPVKLGLTSAPLLLVALFLWVRERRARRRVVDQMFLVKTLMPLVPLRGRALTYELTRLTGELLSHPLDGPRTYSRVELLRKLHELRESTVPKRERAARAQPAGAETADKDRLSFRDRWRAAMLSPLPRRATAAASAQEESTARDGSPAEEELVTEEEPAAAAEEEPAAAEEEEPAAAEEEELVIEEEPAAATEEEPAAATEEELVIEEESAGAPAVKPEPARSPAGRFEPARSRARAEGRRTGRRRACKESKRRRRR